MIIKALTLWQPWASLIALGHKKIETRSRRTAYRGILAIHAAKRDPGEFQLRLNGEKFDVSKLPLGRVVAICRITECRTIQEDGLFSTEMGSKSLPLPNARELEFGNYTPGRVAWILENIVPLSTPIAASGSQSLWDWEVPAGIVHLMGDGGAA